MWASPSESLQFLISCLLICASLSCSYVACSAFSTDLHAFSLQARFVLSALLSATCWMPSRYNARCLASLLSLCSGISSACRFRSRRSSPARDSLGVPSQSKAAMHACKPALFFYSAIARHAVTIQQSRRLASLLYHVCLNFLCVSRSFSA